MNDVVIFLKRAVRITFAAAAIAGAVVALLPSHAAAQIRPAYVRDVDTPALQPFRGSASFGFNAINEQRLITTVPAGKRLVIEHISYYYFGSPGVQFIFGGLRVGQFGPFRSYLQVNPPHMSADSGFFIQDGSMPVRLYFEAGEEVWVSASRSASGTAQFNTELQGYLITP